MYIRNMHEQLLFIHAEELTRRSQGIVVDESEVEKGDVSEKKRMGLRRAVGLMVLAFVMLGCGMGSAVEATMTPSPTVVATQPRVTETVEVEPTVSLQGNGIIDPGEDVLDEVRGQLSESNLASFFRQGKGAVVAVFDPKSDKCHIAGLDQIVTPGDLPPEAEEAFNRVVPGEEVGVWPYDTNEPSTKNEANGAAEAWCIDPELRVGNGR